MLGTSVKKVHGRDIVTGRHRYTSDIKLAGMLHGRVLRPERFNATLVSLDASAAGRMPGVTVVHDGNFVGAVATDDLGRSQRGQRAHRKMEGRTADIVRDPIRRSQARRRVTEGSGARHVDARQVPHRQGDGGRGAQIGGDVHHRLYRARTAGTARRGRRMEWR